MVELVIILLCLGVNALLAAYEMAFVSFSRIEIIKMAKKGSKSAINLLSRRESPERTLSVIQVGITLVGALAAAIGGTRAAEIIEPFFIEKWKINNIIAEALAVLLVILPLTYFSLVFGELIPKTLALRHAAKISLHGIHWLTWAERVLSPAISFLEWSTKIFIRLIFPASKKSITSTESLVEIGDLSSIHQQYILNLARIENNLIKDIMVKWDNVERVFESDPLNKILFSVFSSGHTRLPVVDFQGKIKGILHTKEFLVFRESGKEDWNSIIRPALFVCSEDSALGALRLMQSSKSHMVIVHSDKESLLGIITLEDIMEEIVGELFDEDDDGSIHKLIALGGKLKYPTKNC